MPTAICPFPLGDPTTISRAGRQLLQNPITPRRVKPKAIPLLPPQPPSPTALHQQPRARHQPATCTTHPPTPPPPNDAAQLTLHAPPPRKVAEGLALPGRVAAGAAAPLRRSTLLPVICRCRLVVIVVLPGRTAPSVILLARPAHVVVRQQRQERCTRVPGGIAVVPVGARGPPQPVAAVLLLVVVVVRAGSNADPPPAVVRLTPPPIVLPAPRGSCAWRCTVRE